MTQPYGNGLIGWPVQDGLRRRLGHLASLYIDTVEEVRGDHASGVADASDAVRFAGITMRRRGRRRIVFVSLAGASVEADRITLACGGLLVRTAPNVQVGYPMPSDVEPALFAHYGLRYVPPPHGGRRLVPLK